MSWDGGPRPWHGVSGPESLGVLMAVSSRLVRSTAAHPADRNGDPNGEGLRIWCPIVSERNIQPKAMLAGAGESPGRP
jgi:hypothetical protein